MKKILTDATFSKLEVCNIDGMLDVGYLNR